MENPNKLKEELSKRVNRNQGLLTSAVICGIIAIGSTIGALVPEITSSPALAEIQEGLMWAASTAVTAEAPIFTIMGINGREISLLRKIGGVNQDGKTIGGLSTSNTDCAILEINKREERKKGIHQAMILTAFVAGLAGLGIIMSDKDMPIILQFITKLKDEFIVAITTAAATIVMQLARILKINTEVDLIQDTFGVDDNAVYEANVKNGERGPKVKTLRQQIKAGAGWVSGRFKKKGKK